MTLTIQNLKFTYDGQPVLDGVDLSVSTGELVGLLGPNGSGKSTLLQCINGILDPEEGVVSIDGDSIDELSPNERARRCSYVPQTESGAFPATVFETVMQGRRPHGGWSPDSVDHEAVASVLDRLDIANLTDREVGNLSGGQQQKVRLGRALVGDPSVMLLDEPTSALDLRHQMEVMDLLIQHVTKRGVAGVVAIHDINLAARYCDRIAMLHDGEIYASGPPEVLTPETIRTVYDVNSTVRHHRGRQLIVPEGPADGSTQQPVREDSESPARAIPGDD